MADGDGPNGPMHPARSLRSNGSDWLRVRFSKPRLAAVGWGSDGENCCACVEDQHTYADLQPLAKRSTARVEGSLGTLQNVSGVVSCTGFDLKLDEFESLQCKPTRFG